eukprot:TRINITY_DN12931_c0_g1_i2.p1 TRINITY_DN12931_c0_g1~~TRINITY_DN12931_c0_g1_i2.p1  ORF type:complete len:203 (+),score=45.75 TRINITY_DN12931_c0_g1_i2:34-609(+)
MCIRDRYQRRVHGALPELRELKYEKAQELLDVPYLDSLGTGHSLSSCNHCLHLDCWEKYCKSQTSREMELYRIELRNLFRFCPFCRTACNKIVPLHFAKSTLLKDATIIPIKKEEDFYTNFYSLISYNIQKQDIMGIKEIVNLIDAMKSVLWYSQTVSYTHLTLPTILLVQISVVAVSLKKKNIIVYIVII